jgi:P2 family phage contractile tail tube protein
MNTLYTLEAANLFCGDREPDPAHSNHLTIMNVKLPALEEQYVDHAAGGAPVAIEIATHIARLECTFQLMGWQPYVMTLIGQERQDLRRYTCYGVIRDRRTSKAIEAMAIMEGRLGRVNPTEYRKGDEVSHEYSIRGITHYELYLDRTEIYFWDFFTSTRRIGGADLNYDLNSLLRIPVSA